MRGTKVRSEPLFQASVSVGRGGEGRAEYVTPGVMATTVNPSFSSSCAYCTVSMFWAALETLYAGVGVRALKCAQPMDPRAEEL